MHIKSRISSITFQDEESTERWFNSTTRETTQALEAETEIVTETETTGEPSLPSTVAMSSEETAITKRTESQDGTTPSESTDPTVPPVHSGANM